VANIYPKRKENKKKTIGGIMGCFDTVGKEYIQLKCTECIMAHYEIGDKIPLSEGLYISYEGWLVVKNDKVLMTGTHIYDKWGNVLEPSKIMDINTPVARTIRTFKGGKHGRIRQYGGVSNSHRKNK